MLVKSEHVEFDEDELHDYSDINIEYLLKSLFAENMEDITKFAELSRYFGNDSISDKDMFAETNSKLDDVPTRLQTTVFYSCVS